MDDILAFARHRPPFVSVYLPADTAHESGRENLATEWRNQRRALAAKGAPEEVLVPVDGVVASHRRPGGLAVIVDGDGQVLHRAMAEPPRQPIADVGPLPRLTPLLRWARSVAAAHVVVLADRTGADIVSVVDGEREDQRSVEGEVEGLQKVLAGGWSNPRYQRRAENTWERNAAGVAAEVADVARSIDAAVVVATGDERAVGYLQEHLPEDVRVRLHVSEHGGRAPGADDEAFMKEVQHLVATVGAEETVTALERFAEARGRGAAMADGPGETFTALRAAIVDTLLLHDDPDDDRTAWFSPTAPTLVALEARTLRDLGVEPVEDRLADIAVWSAVGGGGTVRLVPAHGPNVPVDGLGALLRA